MESSGIKTLIGALVITAVLAARPKCGKRSFRAKYGTQGSFQSLEGTKATCKYQIRSAPGLHIRLVLDNYFPDPSDLRVSIVNKKVKNAKTILIPPGPRASLIVEASNVILKIKTSASGRQIDISHEAVIPADGNFGYDFKANRKTKVISSPGFPKTKLPSGIESVWRVTSARDEVIGVEIRRLSTSCDEDYVEILDGSVSVGRYCGKKNNVAVRALSGIMVLRLHTQTATSKGFKARISTEEPSTNGNAEPDIATESSETSASLQCHKRMKMTSDGAVTMDAYSRMTCGTGEICGRMVVEGNSTVGGTQVTREALHCIPPSLCIGNCGKVQLDHSMPGIAVNTCTLSCCRTDFCNKSPDGPDEPPATSDGSDSFGPTPPVGLRCSERSEVTRGSGLGLGSTSSGELCPLDSTCALYIFSGLSDDDVREKVVGYVAACKPADSCNEAECSNLYETRDVNVASCNVSCCTEDNCNDPDAATIPTLPTPEPRARSCYNLQKLQLEGDIHTDIRRYTECSLPEDRCLRVDSYIVDSNGRNGVFAFGKCVPKSSCNDIDCESILELDESTRSTSCAAACCANDLCNERPVAIPAPSSVPSGTGLWCHSKGVTVQEGAIMTSDSVQQNALCNSGDVCALFTFHGTSTESHQIGEPMAGYSAMCQPAASCNEHACETLSIANNIRVTSCAARCCTASMCNEPGETPMPSPKTPAQRSVIQCYEMFQASIGTSSIMNNVRAVTCDPNSVCLRIEGTATRPGVSAASIVTGKCYPKATCEVADCRSLINSMPGLTLQECRSKCCDEELCNDQPIITVSPSAPRQCYDIFQMEMGNLNRTTATTCEAGSACARLEAISQINGLEAPIVYGMCFPEVACDALSCDTLSSVIPGPATIRDCQVKCCTSDLCNIQPFPVATVAGIPATSPSVASPDAGEAAGGASKTITCHDKMLMSSAGITFPGTDDVKSCQPGYQCMSITATASHSSLPAGMQVTINFGTCAPQFICGANDCSTLSNMAGITIKSCDVSCCDTDLCNA